MSSASVTQVPCSKYLPFVGNEYKWFVTLPLSVNGTLSSFEYMNFTSHSSSMNVPNAAFVQGNANHTSYFVVNYATMSQWLPIFQLMESETYDQVLRNLLVQDVFILAQMSHQSIDLPLNMTSAWSKLSNPSFWETVLPLWFEISVALDTHSYYPQLSSELVSLISNVVSTLPTDMKSTKFSSTVLFYDTLYGDSNMINSFLSTFRAGSSFSVAEQKAGYWAVGRYGTEDDYNSLYSLFPTIANNKIQSQNVLLVLTGPQDLFYAT